MRLPLFQDEEIASLYFGGGTPSLHPEVIEAILEQAQSLHLAPNCEITVEANPEQVTPALIRRFKRLGVNRMSLGVQSLDEALLQTLGRAHSKGDAIEAVHTIHREGITNLTIDLMNELPHQTLGSWQETLNAVQTLPITHLSLYNLTFEKNTVFMKNAKQLKPYLPTPEEAVEMLSMATQSLEEVGLKRYEISAFAKAGFEAIHNVGYWTGRPFLGLGPSAFSYFEGKRFRNICHLKRYAEKLEKREDPVDFEECLPHPANLHERLAIELRLFRGVNLASIPPSAHKTVDALCKEGFLEKNEAVCRLTEQGKLFYDTVAERIILL